MPEIDFVQVRGQEAVKRALTVALAGGHNFVLLGPTGTGKTMMIERAVSMAKYMMPAWSGSASFTALAIERDGRCWCWITPTSSTPASWPAPLRPPKRVARRSPGGRAG